MANLGFDEYQDKAWRTAIYPQKGHNLYYPVLGLNGEAGEVAEHVKKLMRDDDGVITEERKRRIKKELGDVMWYMQACCNELGILMSDVAQENLDKLLSRQERGKIKGDGDDR